MFAYRADNPSGRGYSCVRLLALQRRDGQRGYSFAAAHEAHPLAGRELHVHLGRFQPQRLRQAAAHLVAEGAELWRFAGDRCVDVGGPVTRVAQLFAYGAEELDRVGVAPALVGVGEVLAYVAEAGGAEESVDHRVGQDVRVAVARQAGFGLLDLHTAEDQAPPGLEAVGVEADAGAERRAHPIGSSRRERPSNTDS